MADVRWRDRLGTRLGLAFVLTAVIAVGAATVGAVITTREDLESLASEQRADAAADVAAALVAAHTAAGGWAAADLLPAHALAASAGAVLVVTTPTGDELPVPPGIEEFEHQLRRRDADVAPPSQDRDGGPDADRGARPRGLAPGTGAAVTVVAAGELPDLVVDERSTDLLVDGRVVGTARLLFTEDRLDPVAALQRGVVRSLVLAGALAVVLGLVVAAWVVPQLTRPVRRLTTAVTDLAAGDWEARTRLPDAVGELGVLARSVDHMAVDLQREDRLRRALVADVAHEVRTPLSVLLGEVEALEDGVVEPDAVHLASLHEEVLRLAHLVEDLDAIAAAEAAGSDLRREVVDLAAVAADAMVGLEEQAALADVTLDADLVPVTVLGDRRRLEQVVRNLLANAIKFSPAGGRVSLVVGPLAEHGRLEVTDDGPGIPSDELPHVFERFWRGAHARGTPGSGVGLAVVAELVAAHGGTVRAGNAPERGARFTVEVPQPVPGRPRTGAQVDSGTA